MRRNQPRVSFLSQTYQCTYTPDSYEVRSSMDSDRGGYDRFTQLDPRSGRVLNDQVRQRPPMLPGRMKQRLLPPQRFVPQNFRALPQTMRLQHKPIVQELDENGYPIEEYKTYYSSSDESSD